MRPTIGGTASAWSVPSATRTVRTCSGSPTPVTVDVAADQVPICSNARFCSKYVTYIDGERRRSPDTADSPCAPGAVCQTATSRSASGYGSGRRSTASTRLKTAVLAAMPIVNVSSAAVVNAGLRRSARRPWRTSRARSSIHGTPRWSRNASIDWARPAGGGAPASAASARCARSSSSRSASRRSGRTRLRRRTIHSRSAVTTRASRLPAALEERAHDRRPLRPLGFLGLELAPPGGGDRVEARAAAGVGDAPGAADEAALLEAHEPRVQRAHVEAERSAGDLLEPCRNRVAVQRPERGERLQNHEVERALQNVGPAPVSIRHSNGVCRVSIRMSNETPLEASRLRDARLTAPR